MLLYLLFACGDKVEEGEEISSTEYEGDEAGECSDGADNDQDGLFDCDDDGCAGSPDCDGDTDTSDTGDTDDSGDTDTDDSGDTDTDDSGDTDTDDSGDTGDTAPEEPECNPGSGSLVGASSIAVQITGSLLDDALTPPITDLAGWSVAVCDLDNDGFDDVAIGAPYAAGGAGRVALYYGPGNSWNSFMDTTGNSADAYIFADGAQGYLGTSIACSDINGDGADDLVMATGQGEVYGQSVNAGVRAFYNSGTKFSGQIALFDADVALFHDTGYSGDIAHFTYLWNADVDGDGMDEVLFFMNRNSYYGDIANNTDNMIWVLNVDGNESGAMADVVSHKITPNNLDSVTQVSSYASGTFVGQGFDHVSGGIPGEANFVAGTITADLSLGTGSTATFTGSGDAEFGTAAAFADFDQDGNEEAVIGAPGDGGAIYYYGSSTSDFSGESSGSSTADNSFTTSYNNKGLGWRMKPIGDFNEDGHPELLVSTLGERDWTTAPNSETGRAYVVDGLCLSETNTTIETASLLKVTGEFDGDRFGWAIDAGDINGDGKPDLVIGAPYYETSSGIWNGKVYVHLSQ